MSFFLFDDAYAYSLRLLAAALLVSLAGCATRPTSAVLQPVAIGQDNNQNVTLLAVTNRDRIPQENGFGSQWSQRVSYEGYNFSVPSKRDGVADVTRSEKFDGTVAVFVHGYNYSYQEALFRTAQMAADANNLASPVMFSWPSAASVTGYVGDRDAALASRTELDDLLKALSKEPRIKRIILLGHSMGGFLSMEAARQLKLQGRDDVIAKLQIVLAAPDIDLDVFMTQLRDLGRTPTPVTLLVSKSDGALSVSSFVGGERPRVGLLDINDPLIQQAAKAEHVQVIDISSLESSDGLGHDRYASLAKFSGDILKADAKMKTSGGNIGAFVFDAAGAAVASPFRLAGALSRR
jgi:esterase/lipase superfamily enzyme